MILYWHCVTYISVSCGAARAETQTGKLSRALQKPRPTRHKRKAESAGTLSGHTQTVFLRPYDSRHVISHISIHSHTYMPARSPINCFRRLCVGWQYKYRPSHSPDTLSISSQPVSLPPQAAFGLATLAFVRVCHSHRCAPSHAPSKAMCSPNENAHALSLRPQSRKEAPCVAVSHQASMQAPTPAPVESVNQHGTVASLRTKVHYNGSRVSPHANTHPVPSSFLSPSDMLPNFYPTSTSSPERRA